MKKLITAITIALVWGFCTPTYAYEPDRDENIILSGTHLPDPDLTQARSIQPIVTACLHYGSEQLEVTFEYYSGDAVIEVLDWTGMPVYTYACNTMMESNVYLPMPAAEGAYTLKIYIEHAEYVGNFMLVR